MSQQFRPADYPPPVDAGEFIKRPEAEEDERIDVGVLFVGGGPAGLAGAIRLAQYLERHPEIAERLGEVPIAVLDKGKVPGAHQLSGAIVNPGPLRELLPGVDPESLTSYGPVTKESVYVLTRGQSMRIPTPPPFHNKGNYIFSLSRLCRALSERAEELGVMLLPETAATDLLIDRGIVRGVLTGAKGLGRQGEPLGNFEPPAELHAQATVLCEGTQGHLTGALLDEYDLHGQNPQVWALGVKEVWKVARPLDRVIHTMGWPLKTGARFREFGGSFIYPMGDDMICLGFVAGLDYRDVTFSVHDVLQEFKLHPRIRALLEGGERLAWGAKTIPEGGYFSLPKRLAVPGAMIAGDAAGMVNVPKLKGVHYAVRSGMLAADTVAARLRRGGELSGHHSLDGYTHRVRTSEIQADLFQVRNMRQAFHKGFFIGGALAGMMDITKGRIPGGDKKNERDSEQPMFVGSREYTAPDGKLTFDKLASVFASGNRTRDDQPDHIRVQHDVPREIAMTWVNMCPAAVYEIEQAAPQAADSAKATTTGADLVHVKVNASNCVHCGAITAKGGRLTPPEGGSGPEYSLM